MLRGHEEAIPHLLSAFAGATRPGRVGGRSYLPRDAEVEWTLQVMFEQPVEELEDRNMMARSLAGGLSQVEVAAIMAAPNTTFWHLDEF